MSLIEMTDICKSFKNDGFETTVLRGISLNIEEGEYVSIMGSSGAGKTTLMTIMGCMAQPTSGVYSLEGKEVERLDDKALSRVRNEKIGFVFQAFHLLPGVNAFDNVMMPLNYSQTIPEDAEERVQEVLAKVGLEHRLTHTPSQLSGGEQQRVTIARSLINNPRIIMADEPTGNLDSKNSAEIMDIFDQLNREGRTIVLVTHDPDVARHAARIITVKDGQIQSDENV